MRNKSLRRIGLESRIEDLVEDSTVVVADPAAAVPGAEVAPVETVIVVPTSDAELAAVAEAQAEAGDTTDAIDELAVVADRLNEVRSNIEATIPNGGLTQGEAVAYQCATNAIVADVGVSNVLPAMENFGASMSRKEATTVSLEALDKVIEKVLARGKELLKTLGEKLIKLIERIVAYFTSDKSRLVKLKAALETASNNSASISVPVEVAALIGGSKLQDYLNATETAVSAVLKGDGIGRKVKAIMNREAMPVDTFLPSASRREQNGGVNFISAFGLIEMAEFIPASYEDTANYEATVECKGEGDKEISISKADALALVKVLLNDIENGKIKSIQRSATIASIQAIADGALKGVKAIEETESSRDALEATRTVIVGSMTFCVQALSTYSQIFQALVSAASKATSELTKAAPAALPK
jgi:ferritin-like metal-binding protein YciE